MKTLIDSLNEQQRQAVLSTQGPLLVLAGAGSGKTRVLTAKIAHLIEQGVGPQEILAVTFTNKAAKEMKRRITDIVGEVAAQPLWIGTFHSVCGRLLRNEIGHYVTPGGRTWRRNFVIYDESDSMAALKSVIKGLNLDEKLYNPKTIRHLISNLKNDLIDAHQYATTANDFRTEKLGLIYDGYEAALSLNNAIDFDDMLLMTAKLMEKDPEVCARYHQHFRYVLVDEFQDTNNAQYQMIRRLVLGPEETHDWNGRGLTVVGDVDQSIYSWRGANFRLILNFQSDFSEAQTIKLEHNYRSTAVILKVANTIIENNAERLPKSLIPVRGEGEKIVCYEAKDDRDEALFVIETLQRLAAEKNRPMGDCCILYRTNVQSRTLEDVLISRGIAYQMIGGIKFYERREIKDVLAYLTVIFNPQDGYSLKRILNVPKRSIGKTSLDRLEAFANSQGLPLYDALARVTEIPDITPKAQKAVTGFIHVLERLRALSLPVDELMVQIIELTGYLEELKSEDPTDSEGRLANLEEFVSVARQFRLENPTSELAEFLTQMSLLSDIDSAEPAENKLVLMTLHAAKGLEFPIVAIAGMEEGILPHFRALSDADQMEEERRLMYVGVTRAEETLLLTYARRRMIFGEIQYQRPSRFLKEAPAQCLIGDYSLDHEPSRHDEGRSRFDSGRMSSSRGGVGDYAPAARPSARPRPEPTTTRRAPERPTPAIYQGKAAGDKPAAAPKAPVPVFAKGERVAHAKFGEGTVTQVIGEGDKAVYNVKFDGIEQQKLLDPKFARLEKL
jgi:DNA helicase-2/ATP-dependent DNA helicase PcrA